MCISISEQAYMWGLFINCGSSEAFFINSFLDGIKVETVDRLPSVMFS